MCRPSEGSVPLGISIKRTLCLLAKVHNRERHSKGKALINHKKNDKLNDAGSNPVQKHLKNLYLEFFLSIFMFRIRVEEIRDPDE